MAENLNNDLGVGSFINYGISASVVSALDEIGYKEPSEVHAEALQYVLHGGDTVVYAGEDKDNDIVFTLPLIETLRSSLLDRATVGLIITSSSRRVENIANFINKLATDIDPCCLVPENDFRQSISSLRNDRRVIVGTPDIVADFINRREVSLSSCAFFAVDEIDKMLSYGFYKDITRILDILPKHKQGVLIASSSNSQLENLVKKYLINAKNVSMVNEQELTEEEDISFGNVEHKVMSVGTGITDKVKEITNLMEDVNPTSCLVVCNSRSETDLVSAVLKKSSIEADDISFDTDNRDLYQTLDKIKSGKKIVVVATDSSLKDLDFSGIEMVISYSVPDKGDIYIQRSDRARCKGKDSSVFSLVAPVEIPAMHELKKSVSEEVAFE